jgi:hypothetical protein
MSVRKLPFIQAVKLATIDESEVIPTTLYYDQGKVFIGRDAREKCLSPELLIEDFKVELGKLDPDNPTRRSTAADKSPRRTALRARSSGLVLIFGILTLLPGRVIGKANAKSAAYSKGRR